MIEVYKADLNKETVTHWLDTLLTVRKEYENIARAFENDGMYDLGGLFCQRIHVKGINHIADALGLPITYNPEWDVENNMGEMTVYYGDVEIFELYSLKEEKE